uniref:Si:dkey-220k22.1 n=1 Tax=Cyprinus carpio TaxID=7962 RepID=A0A8C2L4H9_CYPCA
MLLFSSYGFFERDFSIFSVLMLFPYCAGTGKWQPAALKKFPLSLCQVPMIKMCTGPNEIVLYHYHLLIESLTKIHTVSIKGTFRVGPSWNKKTLLNSLTEHTNVVSHDSFQHLLRKIVTKIEKKRHQCNCSAEGSVDQDTCDSVTGQCLCLPGYTGQRCDECADAYFTNGTGSCQACDCDSYGAVSQLCNSSGMCICKSGVHGDKCDDCRPGFFNFSSTGCQPCRCNNHSSYCHPQSGICVNCQGNTEGPSCEKCRYNFYRRPGSPVTEPCIPCPCSSVTSTGSCKLDSSGQPFCVQCKPEYQGPNCEQCSDGFYNADSICLPCNCSGNGDPRISPRICHPDTGHCLSCINNTTGPHCERCVEGFTGDALARNCTPRVVHTTPSTTTHWFHYTTMTSSPNATAQSTTFSTTLLSSLGSSTTTVTPLPWNQFNIIVLAVIIIVVIALLAVVGGVYTYREYQNRKLNAPFWTIELKEDNISFSSYHDSIPNADVSGLLEDEVSDMGNGQLALTGPGSLYKV